MTHHSQPVFVENVMLHLSDLSQTLMMGSAECLERAVEMDRRAAECNGSFRESFLRIAKAWRRALRTASYQDGWFALNK